MYRLRLQLSLPILCCIGMIACSSTNPLYEEKLKQDQYLQRNFPAPSTEEKEQPAIKTQYYNEIASGKVVVGMSMLEAQLSTKTYPYGSNRDNTVYWCNKQAAKSCNAQCETCAATLLTPDNVYFLEGAADQIFVVHVIPRQHEDTTASLQAKPFNVVQALFFNRVVEGMSVRDFQRIEQLPTARTEYYCKTQRVFQSCLLDCSECIIKIITPRNQQYHVQKVRFQGHNDYARIVEVSTSMVNRLH